MPLLKRFSTIVLPVLGVLALLAVAASARAAAPRAADGPDSADRLILWTGCEDVAALSDAQLDQWRDRGVDGFVCMVGRLSGLGGSQDFDPAPGAALSGDRYSMQRSIRDSNIVARARQRGMRLYLGVKLVNYFNFQTPLVPWFDEGRWSGEVVPKMRDLAGAANKYGFAGLAFDQELYPQQGHVEKATWDWNYDGNTHSEAETRTVAKKRGAEVMRAVVGAFPGAEIAVHDVRFPEGWMEFVQDNVNNLADVYDDRLDVNFWDGLTSVEGYGDLHMFNSGFYKDSHRGSWDSALQYEQNRTYAYLSREFSNWDYASSRVQLSPFSWINDGPSPSVYDDARAPGYVAEQLLAFRRWGTGGEFANFVYGDLQAFDYSPYAAGMRSASAPAAVDSQNPSLQAERAQRGTITGTADDNLAIRAVRWRDNRGGHGVAELRWEITGGDYQSGYRARTDWSIPRGELRRGVRVVKVRAEDIKGHYSRWNRVRVARAKGPLTRITKRPRKRAERRVSRFRFTADVPVRGFRCRLDSRGWRACDRGRASFRLRSGRHRFEVAAVPRDGKRDRTPARYRFRIHR